MARGEVTGEEEGGDADEFRAEIPAAGERDQPTGGGAEGGDGEAFAHDLEHDAAGCRAEGEADVDLLGALCDGVGEDGEELRGGALEEEVVVDVLGEAAGVGEREVGVEGAESGAERSLKREWIATADAQVEDGRIISDSRSS